MKIYLDSANREEIKSALDLFPISGITTNPSIFKKAGHPWTPASFTMMREFAASLGLEIHLQVFDSVEYENLQPTEFVKIPVDAAGYKLMKTIGKPFNATLVFKPLQAVLAARLGAKFVSPFVGRLDDLDYKPGAGIELIRQIRDQFDLYGFTTHILAASIRTLEQVHKASAAGADAATIPFKVLEALVNEPYTEAGKIKFIEDTKTV